MRTKIASLVLVTLGLVGCHDGPPASSREPSTATAASPSAAPSSSAATSPGGKINVVAGTRCKQDELAVFPTATRAGDTFTFSSKEGCAGTGWRAVYETGTSPLVVHMCAAKVDVACESASYSVDLGAPLAAAKATQVTFVGGGGHAEEAGPSSITETEARTFVAPVIEALRAQAPSRIAPFISAKGLRVSIHSTIDTKTDVLLTAAQLEKASTDKTAFTWGTEEASGNPVKSTVAELFKTELANFSKATLSFNKPGEGAHTINTASVFPKSVYCRRSRRNAGKRRGGAIT